MAQCRSWVADLDHLRLGLQQEHRGASHRADVDRLERRVEHQHATTAPTAGAIGLRSVPPVVAERHGPEWAWGYCASPRNRIVAVDPAGSAHGAPARPPKRAEDSHHLGVLAQTVDRRRRPPDRPSSPRGRGRTCTRPMPRRSGRDSIRVRLIPRARTRPGRRRASRASPSPRPRTTARSCRAVARGGGVVGRGASQAKRVALPGSSSIPRRAPPRRSALPPPACRSPPACPPARAATSRTASAVEAAGSDGGPRERARRASGRTARWPGGARGSCRAPRRRAAARRPGSSCTGCTSSPTSATSGASSARRRAPGRRRPPARSRPARARAAAPAPARPARRRAAWPGRRAPRRARRRGERRG